MNEQTLHGMFTALGIPEWRYLPVTGSTNDDARDWAAVGAADNAVVVADEQTHGRGRMERTWVTRQGAALAFSMVLRPTPAEALQTSLFAPLGGLAVCQALEQLGLGDQARIKWPNDVLLERRKVCGILTESEWQDDSLQVMILGIGVNVAPESVPPSGQAIFPATCIEDVLGEVVNRERLLGEVLKNILIWRPLLGTDSFFQAWEKRLAFIGERVTLSQPFCEPLAGNLLGVNRDGSLRLELETGEETAVVAGDLRLRPA